MFAPDVSGRIAKTRPQFKPFSIRGDNIQANAAIDVRDNFR